MSYILLFIRRVLEFIYNWVNLVLPAKLFQRIINAFCLFLDVKCTKYLQECQREISYWFCVFKGLFNYGFSTRITKSQVVT